MNARCNNPNSISYKNYGGKGIRVCERWESFENFLNDMGERPEGMTLDRLDRLKDYGPSNCRWATRKEQAREKIRTHCKRGHVMEGNRARQHGTTICRTCKLLRQAKYDLKRRGPKVRLSNAGAKCE